MPIYHPEEKKKRAASRFRLIVTRVKCFIWSSAEVEPHVAFSFVSDLSDSGAGLYIGNYIEPGTELRIAYDLKSNPPILCKSVWCNRFALEQPFFGHRAMNFRLGIKYVFGAEAERQRYIDFLAQVKDKANVLNPGSIF